MEPQLPSDLIEEIERIKWCYGDSKCNLCGSKGEIHFEHKLFPDFEVKSGKSYSEKMEKAVDGMCLNCGHFQRFSKLSSEQLADYCYDYPDKSETSKGILNPQYKVNEEPINARIEIITQFLSKIKINSLYIARPSCSQVMTFIGQQNYARVVYHENSVVIDKDIQNSVSSMENIEKGNYKVHGELDLEGNFDAYIINHCLQHVLEVNDVITRIHKLAQEGKSILLMEEVGRKLHNPFHVNHFSESFLIKTLQSKGLRANVIESSVLGSKYLKGLQSSKFISGIHIYG